MKPPTIHPISGGGLTFFQECEKAQKMDSLCRTMARHRSVSQPWCCTVRSGFNFNEGHLSRRLADCLEDARHGKAAAEPWTPSLSASGQSLAVSHSCCRSILVWAGSKQGRRQHKMDPSASQPASQQPRADVDTADTPLFTDLCMLMVSPHCIDRTTSPQSVTLQLTWRDAQITLLLSPLAGVPSIVWCHQQALRPERFAKYV